MEIVLTNVCKSFGETRVLTDYTATFRAGISCIMWPSGAGKTTLLRLIAGFIKPDSGVITGWLPPAFVFQEDRLLEGRSPLQNLTFVGGDATKAAQLLTQAGLGDVIHKKTAELSGGMKRRVCVCRALVADRNLLLLDEPFKGLDAKTKPVIMGLVRESSYGKIVILVTHDADEQRWFCNGDTGKAD